MANGANILEESVTECIESAAFWAPNLLLYSASMQGLDDQYAIITSLISVVTGLGAWGTIAASTKWWGQAVVGVMAFAAAFVGVIPKQMHYGECALKAAALSTEYGKLLEPLRNALAELKSANPSAQTHSHDAIAAFNDIRNKKNGLKPFPKDLEKRRHPTDTEQQKSAKKLGP